MWNSIENDNAIAANSGRATAGTFAMHSDDCLLLREMNHRINNELASTVGLVSRTANRASSFEVKQALAGVIEHLHDHAQLYRVLQMPTENCAIDAAAYLRILCQTISRLKLQRNGIRLVLVEHPTLLDSVQCWRLGLIVSELITNSCRHAFGADGGTIFVELKTRGSQVECLVRDNGISSSDSRPGHGITIVRQLADTLGGHVEITFGQSGTAASIIFPVITTVVV